MASSSQAQTALKTFDLANDVKELTPEEDLIYRFDADEDRRVKNASPWAAEYVAFVLPIRVGPGPCPRMDVV
jgi:COP9 signalosome complex subunit 5